MPTCLGWFTAAIPITERNIRLGWVLASRIARVRMDEEAYREAISLDVPREAIADPHGLAVSRDEKRLVVSAAGTHELLVYRLPDLPFIGVGGPGDLIDRRLLEQPGRVLSSGPRRAADGFGDGLRQPHGLRRQLSSQLGAGRGY